MSSLALLFLGFLCWANSSTVPEQIHLALTNKPSEMSVTWTTPSDTQNPKVQYGFSPYDLAFNASAYETDHYYWSDYTSGAIHYAILTGLKQGSRYFYRVGSASDMWSDVFTFSTERAFPYTFVATGDQGTHPYCGGCDEVISGIVEYNLKKSPIDFVLHAGDLSYANGKQPIWDEWQNQLQPITTNIPYMVTPGNHENHNLWEAFIFRFDMPAEESGAHEGNFFYSYNYGGIHVISLNSESYHWHLLPQYSWLEKDLKSINRTETPWVIAMWHKPWYCSSIQGELPEMRESYEDLLYKYKVDMIINGHVHAYERTHPLYKGQVVSDGIVTVVVGNGGVGIDLEWKPQPTWSAYRESGYGFSTATVYNSTHLHWQMQRPNNTIADDWWFIRDH